MRSFSLIIGEGGSRPKSLLKWWFTAASIVVAALMMLATAGDLRGQQPGQDLQDALDLHRAGKLKDAIDAYSEVLERNPNVVEALNWRAMAYDDLDELDKALADLNKAIQLVPEYADAYNNRGEIYRKKKMFREAMLDYRKAVQLDRNFAEPHYNIALVLEQEKNIGGAIGEYSAYLSLKPNAEDKNEVEEKINSLRKAAAARPAPPGERKPPQVAAQPGAPPEAKPAAPAEAKPAPSPGPPGARPGAPAPKEAVPAKKAPPAAEVPGLGEVPIPPEALALIAGLGVLAMALPLVGYLFFAVMLFLIARKTATSPAWLAFIPIANLFLMILIAGKPIWWLALIIVLPILAGAMTPLSAIDPTGGILALALSALFGLGSAAVYLFVCLGIASARGKSALWGILTFIPCTSPIGLGYLGLSR